MGPPPPQRHFTGFKPGLETALPLPVFRVPSRKCEDQKSHAPDALISPCLVPAVIIPQTFVVQDLPHRSPSKTLFCASRWALHCNAQLLVSCGSAHLHTPGITKTLLSIGRAIHVQSLFVADSIRVYYSVHIVGKVPGFAACQSLVSYTVYPVFIACQVRGAIKPRPPEIFSLLVVHRSLSFRILIFSLSS